MPNRDYNTGWTEEKCRAIELGMFIFVAALFVVEVVAGC